MGPCPLAYEQRAEWENIAMKRKSRTTKSRTRTGGGRPKHEARAPAGRADLNRDLRRTTPYEFFSAAVGPNSVTESWQKGLRRLEEVFDERVASALERLGIPSAAALARLERKIDELAVDLHSLARRRHKP